MWVVDKDLISGGRDAGVCSVNFNDQVPLTHKFALFDDDGNRYYEGRTNYDKGPDAFAPLDDWGEPNAGCTAIEIDGKIL